MEVWTLTSFTMLRLGSQEAGARRSTRMKRTSFPGTELATCTSQGQGVAFSHLSFAVPTSPILHAVRCQHSCSPRAAPTTLVIPSLSLSCSPAPAPAPPARPRLSVSCSLGYQG